jgi:hypothetical protein
MNKQKSINLITGEIEETVFQESADCIKFKKEFGKQILSDYKIGNSIVLADVQVDIGDNIHLLHLLKKQNEQIAVKQLKNKNVGKSKSESIEER